jgi:hypothetical protein
MYWIAWARGQRSAWIRIDDVALDLAARVAGRQSRVLDHVLDRLGAGPALGVDSRVDDEAYGAKQLGGESAETVVRGLMKSCLHGETFRVESPTFDKDRE